MACGIIGHTCNGREGEGRREEEGGEETKKKGRSVGSWIYRCLRHTGWCVLRATHIQYMYSSSEVGKIKRNRCYKITGHMVTLTRMQCMYSYVPNKLYNYL